MKRTITILLALTLALGAVSCGGNNGSTDTSADTSAEATVDTSAETTVDTSAPAEPEKTTDAPVDILKKVWESYGEDEKFASTGGDFGEEIVEGPGAYAALDAEVLDSVLGFPAASIDKIDSAASFMHMMNANTFTSGAYHVKDSADIETLATELRDNIQARQWMCGFPDNLVVASVGDVVISAFGKKAFIDTFVNKLSDLYPDANVIITEPIE
ncbi:MAG: bacteriocin transport accessory protein [Candidatus Flemingiibacterium sp.]